MVHFRDWKLKTGELGDGYFIQWVFQAPCTITGKLGEQTGGKFYVSKYAAHNEVIRTAHKAVLSAIIHEVDEDFKVSGVAIYHPHIGVNAILEAGETIHEYRK